MTDYDTYAGFRVTELSIYIPLVGLWVADIKIATPDTIPATGLLVHGNLSLQGAVYRAGSFAGQTSARLFGGFGGWNNTPPARSYMAPFGVSLALVLGDLARDVGERVNVPIDTTLGNFWTRPGLPSVAPAGRTLRAAAGASWWIDGSGVVQVTPRSTAPIVSDWQAIDWHGSRGVLLLASEDPASWMPGRTFQSPLVQPVQQAQAIRHYSGNDGVARVKVTVA